MATGFTYSLDDRCKLPGCSRLRYRESTGWRHDFCGRTHAQEYREKYGVSPTPPIYTGRSTKSVSSSKPKPMKAKHNLVSRLPSSLVSKFGLSSRRSIKFYHRDEPYYEFTNFYQALVLIDGKKWPSTEHYFQAQKFVGTPYVDMIRLKCSAREAFQLSRDPTVSQWRRSDWDAVKDDIMLKALRCKFAQHSDLREKLWKTGDKKLIEHTTNDSYWADGGGSGRGLNKLGKLLMKVRDDIVAKRGHYVEPANEPSKKSSDRVSLGQLKRSSSMTDLSKQTASKKVSPSPWSTQSDDFLSSQFHSASLGTSKNELRRSSSHSLIPRSDSFSSSSKSIGSPYRLDISSKPSNAMLYTSTSSSYRSKPCIKSTLLPQSTSRAKSYTSGQTNAHPKKFYGSSSNAYYHGTTVMRPLSHSINLQVKVVNHTKSLPGNQRHVKFERSASLPPTRTPTQAMSPPPSYSYRPQQYNRSTNPINWEEWSHIVRKT